MNSEDEDTNITADEEDVEGNVELVDQRPSR
jgi:hypothetical protein